MTLITPGNLEQRGYRLIEWNRGIILEYWKSFHDGSPDFRIGVRFGEFKDVPSIVWLIFPNYMYALKHFTSVEQIEQLLGLLGGP
jgi:hypothetical protein